MGGGGRARQGVDGRERLGDGPARTVVRGGERTGDVLRGERIGCHARRLAPPRPPCRTRPTAGERVCVRSRDHGNHSLGVS